MIYPWIRDLYGQVRGYDRLRIRREAGRNAQLRPAELDALTRRLLAGRVMDAIRRFPAYADKVREWGGGLPESEADVRLESLPIWTREDQNRLFEEIKPDVLPGAIAHATGGSSGVPVHFHLTRESYEWRTAVSDRGYAWANAEEGRRAFFVWGAPIAAPTRLNRLKSGLHHALQGRAFFDSFVFDIERMTDCCNRINCHRPESIVGYAGNLVSLARFVRDRSGALKHRARTAITGAEGLQPGQRELIQEYLADEVFMSYGSREFMLIGMECPRHRGYHIASDNVFIEVVDEQGQPLPPGEIGRILVSDLRNAATPFLRYEIGDMGSLSGEPCPCGLPFPLLASVDGRMQEVISLPDGGLLSALFLPHLMKEFKWVEGYQLARVSSGSMEIRLITRTDPTAEQLASVEGPLREKIGPAMTIRIKRVEGLSRNSAGKVPVIVEKDEEG